MGARVVDWIAWVLAGLLLLAASSQPLRPPAASVWPQPDAPIRILDYRVTVAAERSKLLRPGVHHRLEYANRGDREVEAIAFALINLDLWNELLSGFEAVVFEPLPAGESKHRTWVDEWGQTAPVSSSLALVRRVRFVDGEVWQIDDAALLGELQRSDLRVPSLVFQTLEVEGALPCQSTVKARAWSTPAAQQPPAEGRFPGDGRVADGPPPEPPPELPPDDPPVEQDPGTSKRGEER